MGRVWRRSVWLSLLILTLMGCSQPDKPSSQTRLANHGLLSAALSPGGERLFTGSFQHGGALWDQDTFARIYDWNHGDQGYSAYHAADFSEDGEFLAATDGFSVTIWNTASGKSSLYLQSPAQNLAVLNSESVWQSTNEDAKAYWQRPARITDLALSKQYLLLGLENQIALLVDVARQIIIGALGHEDPVTDLGMDDAAHYAVTGTRGGVLTLWSLESGMAIDTVQYEGVISFAAISPAGDKILVAAANGPVELLEYGGSGQLTRRVKVFHGNPGIIAAGFSESGLLLGSSREQIWRFDSNTGEALGHWQVPAKGPWHKSAIVALSNRQTSIQAITSDGFAYQLN